MKPLLALLFLAATAFASSPGWTTYNEDGSVQAKAHSTIEDGKLIRAEIFDAEDRLQFIEISKFDAEGKHAGVTRQAPDGNAWPYEYRVYGAPALGGIDKLKQDIERIELAISKLDDKHPILEITFTKPDRVKVKTGTIRGPLNAKGRYFDLIKNADGYWVRPEGGAMSFWVS